MGAELIVAVASGIALLALQQLFVKVRNAKDRCAVHRWLFTNTVDEPGHVTIDLVAKAIWC